MASCLQLPATGPLRHCSAIPLLRLQPSPVAAGEAVTDHLSDAGKMVSGPLCSVSIPGPRSSRSRWAELEGAGVFLPSPRRLPRKHREPIRDQHGHDDHHHAEDVQ